jgi:4-diphosphocytidyl-2-C-methyl-D-erythritol kinase
MRVRTVAPAKVNWTLEVLGKRDDGYHEIKSVMQTIDLCDEVVVTPAPDLLEETKIPEGAKPGMLYLRGLPHRFYYGADHGPVGDEILGETVISATRLLDPDGSKDARVDLNKKIPVAAGLGGGSSDAAAALRVLDRLWGLELRRERLEGFAVEIGSDVTFFLSGGTALAEGRGERITPLPDAPETWLVVVAPPIKMEEKTKRMYGSLTAGDFGDGQRTESLVRRIEAGEAVRDEDMCNTFERAAYESFEGLAAYRDAFVEAGARGVHLAGAGPALFSVFESSVAAEGVAGRLAESDARVFVARTLGADEATRVVVEG